MSSRRQFMQGSVALPALAAGLYQSIAAAQANLLPAGQAEHKPGLLLVDDRYEQSKVLAEPFRTQGVRVIASSGDLTELWLGELSRLWQDEHFSMAGLTGEDSLFVLEMLAFDHQRRVVCRQELGLYSELDPQRRQPLYSWLIVPYARNTA